MPVSKTSPKILQIPAPQIPTAQEVIDTVDEFGRLADLNRAPVARQEKLRKRILSWHADMPAGHYATEQGNIYNVEISPKKMERKVTALGKLCKFLGVKKFLTICKVNLEQFEPAVPPEERAPFIIEDRTGGRNVTPMKRVLKEAA